MNTNTLRSLVRELLLTEAEAILADRPDHCMVAAYPTSATDYVRHRDAEAAMVDAQWNAALDYEERLLAVARRLFAEYATVARADVRRMLSTLPTVRGLERAQRLGGGSHELCLEESKAQLRQWAEQQLRRVRDAAPSTNVDCAWVYVYLTIRDAVAFEAEQREDESLAALVTGSFGDAR